MIGKWASNDLAESTFAGVTAQIQSMGINIGLCAAAAVSDCDRNGFLHRGTIGNQIKRKSSRNTHKKKKENKRGLYNNLPKELQVILMMTCIEDAPETKKIE